MNYKVILTHAVSSNLAITSYFTFKLQELIWSIELLINKNFSFLSIFFISSAMPPRKNTIVAPFAINRNLCRPVWDERIHLLTSGRRLKDGRWSEVELVGGLRVWGTGLCGWVHFISFYFHSPSHWSDIVCFWPTAIFVYNASAAAHARRTISLFKCMCTT